MVRLKDKDNLDDLRGKLVAGFSAVELAFLEIAFLQNGAADKKEAVRVLEHFYRVAGTLRDSENEFKTRRRAAINAPSIMPYLRGTNYLTAMREFTEAKGGLLGINPAIGKDIIRLAARDLDQSVKEPSSLAP